MNGYELSRNWFDFCFENPEKINPNHTAIYFFAIEHCNRLGWKKKFGFPSQMTMDALGIKKHQTYIKYFNDLVDWSFFDLIQKSRNQYSANIISLMSAMPKNGEALDKAIIKHAAKQTESNGQSNSSIDKQRNKETKKPLTSRFAPPTIEEVQEYCTERGNAVDPEKFISHYETSGWVRGKTKIKCWKACVRTWEKNSSNSKPVKTNFAGYSIAALNTIVDKMKDHQATTHDIQIFTEASKDGFKPNE